MQVNPFFLGHGQTPRNVFRVQRNDLSGVNVEFQESVDGIWILCRAELRDCIACSNDSLPRFLQGKL